MAIGGCAVPDRPVWHYAGIERTRPRPASAPAIPTVDAFPKTKLPAELLVQPKLEPPPKPKPESRPKPQAPAPERRADGWYYLKDKTGKEWRWTEPAWLNEYVRRVNSGEARTEASFEIVVPTPIR
jgi:hypothetical protein